MESIRTSFVMTVSLRYMNSIVSPLIFSSLRFLSRMESYGRNLVKMIKELVYSKTVFFIWGLIFSLSFVEYGVVSVLMDYLKEIRERPSLREASMAVNLLDGLSDILAIVVTHISEAYTGRFNIILFCTGAYAMGLMLLWVDHKSVNIRTLTIALGLIALGKAVKEPTTSDFLEYQLSEKVKKKGARATRVRGTENNINGDDEDQELSQRKERILVENSTTFWVRSASFFGAFYAVSPSTLRDYWLDSFKISALFMGAMHILFYSGIFCYHPEGKPLGSPFTTFYKVFKAAFKRRSLEYPRLEHGNDSNNISVDQFHTSNDPNINNVPFYIEGEEVHLSPRLTLFTFLDKAAIINGNPSDLCTIEQVREVKRFCPVVAMSSIFWAYTLVVASGNTYFVEQSNHLQTVKGGREIPISFFFILKALTCDVVIFLVGKFGLWMTPIRRRIGVGMFCAVLCCITAWQVELHRLTLIKEERVLEQKDPNKVTISLDILILTPQYILLGLMEGLAEHGLEEFFQNHLSESMKKFGDSLTKVVMGIGKLSNVVFVLILHGWFKESIDTSNMDRYFLFLAILNSMFLVIYVCYCYYFRHIRSDINVTGGDDVPQRPLENDVAQAVVQGQEKPDDDDDASERRTITS